MVVADHCGGSAGRAEIPIKEYQIPLVMYAPGIIAPQKVDKLCSQIDLTPTLLGILNWSYESTFYGKDIMKMTPDEERAFVGTYQKLGYLKGNKLSILSTQQRFSFYQFDRYTGEETKMNADTTLKHNAVTYYQTAEYMFVHGSAKFMNGFIEYVKTQHKQFELFRKPEFRFGDSKREVLIQLADFISGSLARCYDPEKRIENPNLILDIIEKNILHLREWPETIINATNISTDSDEQFNHESLYHLQYNPAINHFYNLNQD